ncbi:cysteine proteinase [Hesseltinella vesiculosa]|uniref:ubiquitinyl hydrolase 1 n=1 Tax=Hesseltinella vesiculosa TaxID=101127 RepID=A0A1X2GNS8_9FUNG|nr:cysteine proteinase [Hesseltinella vesiculosa]
MARHHRKRFNGGGHAFEHHRQRHHRPDKFKQPPTVHFNKKRPLLPHQSTRLAVPSKQLPLPKGPLFDRSKILTRWRQPRTIGPGLMNGQNTCFLNSVLECLTYTPSLAQFFLYEGHRRQCTLKHFCAMCAMDDHVHRCLKDQKSMSRDAAILPRAFTSNLRAFSSTLRLGRQEDAHEFMMFLLDAMHKSTVYDFVKLDSKAESTSFIYQIFGGRLQSQLRCHSCHARSNTYDNFLDLSVDLTQGNSVKSALENFIKVDMIGGSDPDSKYRCDACKQKVNAGKQMTIHELPSMLSIHLKRFTFDMTRGYMRKVTKPIIYEETLDMAPYVSKEAKTSSAKYQLYAVLVHLGHSCDSGHYYAYVKAPNGQWFRMDDEDVTPVTLKEVLAQQAYMLFYSSTSQSTPTLSHSNATVQQSTKSKTESSKSMRGPPPSDELATGDLRPVKRKAKTVNQDGKLHSPPAVVAAPEPKKQKVDENTGDLNDGKSTDPMAALVMKHVANQTPGTWLVQSASKPFRSLRGNLSPPTFAAAVSDNSAWHVQDQVLVTATAAKTSSKKQKRHMKSWNVQEL